MYFLQVNLVDWLKVMVGSRQIDGVCDPRMEVKPSLRALKRVLLVSLRCVDPDAEKRPKISHVIQMLETEDNPFHEVRLPMTIGVNFVMHGYYNVTSIGGQN